MINSSGPSLKKTSKPRGKAIFLLAGFLIAAIAGGIFGFSQQPAAQKPEDQQKKDQEGFKIGVEVNMVTVPVTIRKPAGGFVRGLTQQNFRITEDGEDQEIQLFVQEAVPTRIAIVLDISGSVLSEWGTIKYSTRKFADNLKQDDMFSLVTFNTEIRLKMDWGRKTDRLDAVLGSIYCKDNTKLWDAMYVVSNDVFRGIKEKKAIIIMSDGLDNDSGVSYGEALEAAVRSEAAVYVVSKTQAVRESIMYQMAKSGYYERIPQEVFAQADQALRKLAYETGGRVLYPNSFGQLDNIYADVDEELRNQYLIGYTSSNPMKDGKYRRIQVAVNQPDIVVSSRPGYYARNEIPGRSVPMSPRKN
jgi:Ca-activated chloride channel homolog